MNSPKILIIGDSWSSGYRPTPNGPVDHDGWPQMLTTPELCQGVAGSTAAQWAADFEGRLTKAIATEADVIILSLLGNDAFAAVADGHVTADEILSGLSNYHKVVTAARKTRTIVLQYTDPFFGQNPMAATACPLVNAAIRGECPDGVEIFDTSTVLRPEHFDGRDIHPNMEGHKAIAEKLREIIDLHEHPSR